MLAQTVCCLLLLYEGIWCTYIDAIKSTLNLTFPVLHLRTLTLLWRIWYDVSVEQKKTLAQIICRFVDDAALLTHIGLMIRGRDDGGPPWLWSS